MCGMPIKKRSLTPCPLRRETGASMASHTYKLCNSREGKQVGEEVV